MPNGTPQRAPGLAVAIGALGLFCGYMAVTGFGETLRDLAAEESIVRVRAGAAAAAPTAAMLLLSALLLFREPTAKGQREKRLFGAVLACLPLIAIMPLGLNWSASIRLVERGYTRCEGPMGSRGWLTRTWARRDTPCPAV